MEVCHAHEAPLASQFEKAIGVWHAVFLQQFFEFGEVFRRAVLALNEGGQTGASLPPNTRSMNERLAACVHWLCSTSGA